MRCWRNWVCVFEAVDPAFDLWCELTGPAADFLFIANGTVLDGERLPDSSALVQVNGRARMEALAAFLRATLEVRP